tara:strand:- start:18 stop:815 length:798 start_codon:yes stop_codon:yes gene_type:complete
MFKVSCIQLNSNNDVKNNLETTKNLIKKAIKQGANLILTPEVSSIFSLNKKELEKKTSSMKKDIYLNGIKQISKRNKKWILIGSMIIRLKKNKFVNRSILINPRGKISSYYDKINMYDAKLSKKEVYKESNTFSPGNKTKIAKLPWGKLGMSVCYDLRFPNMYRQMAQKGANFLSVPSAFTRTTGKKHWHTLLKARAIENYSFVFAPAQCGTHHNGRKTFGHSLIVSPDGKILKEIKNNKKGVITVSVNEKETKFLRKRIPSLNI